MTAGFSTIRGSHRGYSYLIEKQQDEDSSKWIAHITGPDCCTYGEPGKLTYSNYPNELVIAYIDGLAKGKAIYGRT